MREQDERGRVELAERRTKEKTRKEEKELIARNALKKGLSISDTSELTGLSVEEIEKLK
jgi:predicted transposase YdaD